MVLINNLTIDEINAALLHLQRARTEVVGGTKGSTVQNITISNKGGGSTVDYAPTITALSNRIDKNTNDIESVEGEIDKIQATLEQLSDNGISSMTFDPISRQLQINTQDGEVYSCDITSENIILNFDATTNKLTLEMGEQYQEVTLPYINANEKGSANGVATLDSSGRVPYSQLPESAMEFLGNWNASTNTPHLQDGTGTNGDFYVCNVGGTVTFGTGNTQIFVPNDRVIYNGTSSQWVKLPAGQVSSVNGQSGAVTLTASDIEYSTGVSIKDKIDANAVQADWNVSDTTSLAYIKNKPTIPASPVQSDWNVTDTTSLAYIKNKPSVAVLGNTAGCALGTASAGSCTTAARSDHVHPMPAVLGGIALNAGNNGNFNEGLRINVANNGYATINIGAAAGTTSGAGGFWIGTNCTTAVGKLYINYGTSNKASYFCCCSDGTVFWCGNVCGTATSSDYLSTYAVTESNNISALKAIFNTAPKSVGTAVRLQHSTHSMAFGWFLDGYACANAFGGWFVSDYNIPRFVGIRNGAWKECTIITSDTIGSQHVACADHATCADCASCAGTVMGDYVCGWDWIGACARIYRVLNGVYLFQIYGNTCEDNVFEAFCRFVCSRNLVLFSTCYHSLNAMGTATQLNTCHCSIGSVCWDESSGNMYRWTFHGAAGYKTFNKDCACSINLNMISFIMGL